MAIRSDSRVVEFDADAALAAAEDVAGSDLYSFVEYDVEEYNVQYLSDFALQMYETEEQAYDHFDRIHSHVHLDFTEIDLFTEGLFPIAEDVEYVTTSLDFMKLVRVYHDDMGIFVSLAPHIDEVPVIEAIRNHMTA